MSDSSSRPTLRLWSAFAFLVPTVASWVVPPIPVAGQQASVLQGVVADEVTRERISSATVSLVGVGMETRSAADGSFAFPGAPLGQVSVRVQAPGYTTVIEDVTVTAGMPFAMEVMLPRVDAVLRELVVVGRATKGHRPSARTAADLLAAKVAGIRVYSGILGRNDGPVVLRGVTSFRLSSEPLLFLDGVQIKGGLGQAMDLLMHIPASDVEDIEVRRGPSSVSVSGAANGVIYVRTKVGPGEG